MGSGKISSRFLRDNCVEIRIGGDREDGCGRLYGWAGDSNTGISPSVESRDQVAIRSQNHTFVARMTSAIAIHFSTLCVVTSRVALSSTAQGRILTIYDDVSLSCWISRVLRVGQVSLTDQ